MQFVTVNDDLVELIASYVEEWPGFLIDCGAGEGHLTEALVADGLSVIAIDVRPDGDLVLQRDATGGLDGEVLGVKAWTWSAGMIPVIARPCHGGFASRVLKAAQAAGCVRALYIGKAENVADDLGEFEGERLTEWCGKDGEDVYEVLLVAGTKNEELKGNEDD